MCLVNDMFSMKEVILMEALQLVLQVVRLINYTWKFKGFEESENNQSSNKLTKTK